MKIKKKFNFFCLDCLNYIYILENKVNKTETNNSEMFFNKLAAEL